MATFITSKAVGQTINISVTTSTGYWKYNHNGTDSSVFSDGNQTITVANANGEFTLIPCLSDGTSSGDIIQLNLSGNQITSFDGTGLISLTELNLKTNQITSFDGTGLTSLTNLNLGTNQLTSFDGTGLTSLASLYLSNNQLTSFNGTGLTSLTNLYLNNNQLTSFDGTGLTSLTDLGLGANQLTSFDGTGLTSLTALGLANNPLATFIGGDMGLITQLNFQDWNISTLTSFNGTGLTSLTYLYLNNNQLTSFDGTGLTSLIELYLGGNQITSLDGFILPTSLTGLGLSLNQLTSFDGTGLTSLTTLDLDNNQITLFDGTDLTSLNELVLVNNLLTSIDVSPMVALTALYLADVYGLNGNPMTASSNDTILADIVAQNRGSMEKAYIATSGGRTSAGTSDYNTLIAEGWNLVGLELVEETTTTATFITSKAVGQTINISVTTSTGYWKYNHNGTDSSVFSDGNQTITVANANGEFTLIPCLSDGTVSGDITSISLGSGKDSSNQITSFNGTGLTSLSYLALDGNLLTSFNGTDLTSLSTLYLQGNQLTSFDGTDLTSLISLNLVGNQLTSLDVSPMVNLTQLYLADTYGLNGNPMTATANNNVLSALVANGLTNGTFSTANGRTSTGTSDYNSLIANGWNLVGLELITPPPSGNGKLRIKGVNSGGGTTTTTTTEAPTTTTTTTVPTFNLTFENGLSDQLVVLSYFTLDKGGDDFEGPGGFKRRGPGGNFGPSFTEYGSMVTDENGQVVFNSLPNDGSNWKIDVYYTSLQDGMVVYTTVLALEPYGPQLHEDTTLTRNFYNVDFLNQDDSGILSGKDVDIYYIPRSLLTMDDVDIFPILMFSGTTDVNGTINTSLSDGSYIIRTYEDNGDLSWGQYFDVEGGTVSIYRPLSTDVEIVVNNLTTTIWNNMVPTNNSPVEGIDIYYYDNSDQVYSFDPSQPIGNNNSQVIPPLTLLGQTDSNGQLSTNGTPVSIESGYIGVVWGSTDSEGRLYSTGRTESLINDLGVNGNGVKTITLDTDIYIRWAEWHPVINLSGKSVILSRFNGSEWVPFDSYTSIADSTNPYFGYLTGGVEYKLEVYNTQTTGDIGYSETWTPTWGESKTTNVTLS